MNDDIFPYVLPLYRDVPSYVYNWLQASLCVGAFIILAFNAFRSGSRFPSLLISVWRGVCALLLTEYIAFLFCLTVLFRAARCVREYDLRPFWSYAAIREGEELLLVENAMNVVVFVPVGLLLGLAFRSIRWWQVILIGGGISISIEALQYFTCRGFSEVDDVMHNTLGCIAGFAVYKVGERICNVRR